jgi:hypothetical protein
MGEFMQEEKPDNAVRRRQVLRRGATLAAGVAGAGVVGAVTANPAQAAPGEPVVQGATNAAGNSTTAITSTSATDATLALTNTNGAPLRLGEGPIADETDPVGTLSYGAQDYWAKPLAAFPGARVHTDYNSNRLVPIIPARLVDTRDPAQRTRIFNTPASAFDSVGRLRPGQTMHIDLADFVFVGETVFGNVTTTQATGNGLFTIYPFNIARPNTSTLNYPSATVLASLANFFNCALGYNESIGILDAISVFCTGAPGHVIIDITAFTVGSGEVLAHGPFLADLEASMGSAAARRQAKALARRAANSE